MNIEKAFLINLPESTDRLLFSRRQLDFSRFPQNWEIMPAVRVEEKDKGSFVHAGEMGCYRSQLKCLEIAKNCKSGHTLIMEDDLVFNPTLLDFIPQYMELLDQDDSWDVFHFYNTFNSDFSFRLIKDVASKATHFMLFNKKSIDYIYELISRREMPLDHSLRGLHKLGLVKMYSAGQQLVCQNTSRCKSDIYNGRLGWFRRNFNGVCI